MALSRPHISPAQYCLLLRSELTTAFGERSFQCCKNVLLKAGILRLTMSNITCLSVLILLLERTAKLEKNEKEILKLAVIFFVGFADIFNISFQ